MNIEILISGHFYSYYPCPNPVVAGITLNEKNESVFTIPSQF